MFMSRTSRASRLPHIATAVALAFTVALGLMQSSAHGDDASASTASVAIR